VDIVQLILLITFFIIFTIFLFFDIFKRNEKYGYMAYLIALLPMNYLWYVDPGIDGVMSLNPLLAYLVLFILWSLCLIRDIWGVYNDKKSINQMVLFLILAIFIQLILTAILPEVYVAMKANNRQYWFFWLPDVYHPVTFAVQPWVNLGMLGFFKIMTVLLIFLVIVPLILDLKDEEVSFWVIILIVALFIIPFLYLSYVLLPEAMWVLTFMFCVVLFVILLILTRSGKEEPKPKKKKEKKKD